jgi:hypothetical protein
MFAIFNNITYFSAFSSAIFAILNNITDFPALPSANYTMFNNITNFPLFLAPCLPFLIISPIFRFS